MSGRLKLIGLTVLVSHSSIRLHGTWRIVGVEQRGFINILAVAWKNIRSAQ